MDNNDLVIGIDIGGTKIAAGLVNTSGNIIEKKIVSTDLSGKKTILYQLKNLIESFIKQKSSYTNILGIGIGLPGTVDQKKGIAVRASNLPYKSLALGPELNSYFSLPVFLENDGDAGTLGEKWFGGGKGKDKFIYFTVGTGIGAGIIADGNLIRGCEIGHTIVKPEGPVCKCGSQGCLEAVASGPAIARLMKEKSNKTFSTREVFALAEKDNKIALKVIDEASYYLALGLINIWQIIDPELIILGGGVIMGTRHSLLSPVKKHINNVLPSGSNLSSSLKISKLEQSGMIGAAAVLLEKNNDDKKRGVNKFG